MIGIVKQAIDKATDEMIKESSKKAGQYAVRVVALGAAAIGGNYVVHKTKEKGIELTKNIEKGIKESSQEMADVINQKKKPEPIKAGKKIVVGAGKAVGVAAIAGLGAIGGAMLTGYVREKGKDLTEEVMADYRKMKYFVEEETAINTIDDEIEYL